ncbi:MAG: DegT/DnrJ/EryC1/StrS family aminotransferase [Rhodospirillaceae bacterium]|jgi:CDP-6-deoxy-D-xylo-4-hexulose-3-dehydrase|nr:DegT/DnrJ/EryC1/StrS family aminotransferase [Rhodospirillaceae bacterium]MBT3885685.1 DegT/DnrJ/EryC1/StrS family aminotransferase [Rhodospirillaceae bacterium]MBT4117741.1 DegT/DnrJ/EryC1/StrS family aminotransferase [Rhodospirillaceae bacterium]MBT4748847.1 DegT/DnrJ/EryC1/StrS family aminotransferase [Rhodospirillaceae bacterium]MBT5177481.1 DegT/DnrJ/EryC1/StrS family aminotransferase [Rhodospirillaceae bacterium]
MTYELAADSWGPEERAAIDDVIASGRLTMGPKVAEFERAFADYFGRKYAVMVNSGSSANLVGIAALCYRKDNPLQPGDEVIVPAISWSTTYHPLQQYGLKLRFVDVELDTLNMDTSRLEEALTPSTRMIVGVSILGNPAALDVMRAFADKHGLIFFEDNCESMDAELVGQKTGTFGDIGTFSTFFSHHISTIEGGVLTTDDAELNDLARSIRAHGWTRDVSEGSELFAARDDDFFEAYRFILPGYNVRPQEINAAVGLVQLAKLPAMTEMRRKNLAKFQNLFEGDERFIIQRENGKSSSFCFTIILSPGLGFDRDVVMEALKAEDIGFRIITGGCFPRHDVIKYFDYELLGEMTNGDLAHDRGFFVGNHPFDLGTEIDALHRILDAACK